MSIKLKTKHWQLGNHFVRFIDPRWYPNFVLTEENLLAFIKIESYGFNSLSDLEKEIVKPLMNGKELEALTFKMVHEEMAECWSIGAGWFPILANNIYHEFIDRSKYKNKIWIKKLISIFRKLKPKVHSEYNMINLISEFSGFSNEEKQRYLNNWNRRVDIELVKVNKIKNLDARVANG